MAVIINDLEVVLPPPKSPADTPAETQSSTDARQRNAPALTPGDMEQIVWHLQLRELRVAAH